MRGFFATMTMLVGCPAEVDGDADGYAAEVDCDDTRDDVHPGAGESCDGRDEDCDGEVDENPSDASEWFLDGDADGFGGDVATTACVAPDGYTSVDGDCDDQDPARTPGPVEVCDGVDNDCEGDVDEACGSSGLGEVAVSALGVRLINTCEAEGNWTVAELFDVHGDGASDLVASLPCEPWPLVVAAGPLGNETDVAAATVLYAGATGRGVQHFSGGLHLDGDGVLDWAVGELDEVSEEGQVRVFAGGGAMPVVAGDALATVAVPGVRDTWSLTEARPIVLGESSVHLAIEARYSGEHDAQYVLAGELTAPDVDASEFMVLDPARSPDGAAAAGDIDGDGALDLITTSDDAVAFFPGPFANLAIWVEPAAEVMIDEGVRGWARDWRAADLDGDGRDDFVLTAYAGEDTTVLRSTWEGDFAFDTPVLSVSSALVDPFVVLPLDHDGDGVIDLALAGNANDPRTECGAALVEFGPFDGAREAGGGTVVRGESFDAEVGSTLSVGDTNADGFDDVLIGGRPVPEDGTFAWLLHGGP